MARPATQAISFRIPVEKINALERLAKATDRPRSWHIEQALDSYLENHIWQIAQTEQAITELDAGLGIAHAEIKQELRDWGKADKKTDGAKRDR